MAEEPQQEMQLEDELLPIGQRACTALLAAGSDVETMSIQYVTEGVYRLEITERGCQPREEEVVQLPPG
jgi:hypothetical protein